jgi:hypothetical protein
MTITLTREEAQRMLSELEGEIPFYSENDCSTPEWITDAIETLRARLSAPQPEYRDVVIKGDLWRIEFLPDHAASVVLVRANYEAQPEPEPVADKYLMEVECTKCGAKQDGILTVNAPPQREWQGLTDEEISELIRNTHNTGSFVRAIEAKLREKNA